MKKIFRIIYRISHWFIVNLKKLYQEPTEIVKSMLRKTRSHMNNMYMKGVNLQLYEQDELLT